jgi:hypothetical protein
MDPVARNDTPLLDNWQLLAVGAATAIAAVAFLSTVLGGSRGRAVRIAKAELGRGDPQRYASAAGGSVPTGESWCGIFALWVLRQAGLTDWTWQWGWGFISKLPRTSNPQPGDIAFKQEPFQHQAVVEKAKGGYVWTINGNSDGGRVVRKVHPISYWTEFRSIQPLVDGCREEKSCLTYSG